MAKTACVNGHPMWNGDGKPIVWAFRVNYIIDYCRHHPDCVLGSDFEKGQMQMYDLVDDAPEEDLDCWYCDECRSLAVFVEHYRYDYVRTADVSDLSVDDAEDWEEYIALRYLPFEKFQDFYEGLNPVTAISEYTFPYRYMVSPDRKRIYAIDRENHVAFVYQQVRFIDFDNQQNTDEPVEEYEFNIEELCRKARDIAEHFTGEILDRTAGSINILDAVIMKARNLRAKQLIDENVMWNTAVCVGTYFGEIMLADSLREKGFSWNTGKGLPVLTAPNGASVVDPIGEAHKAMYISEASAEHDLREYYSIIQLLMNAAPADPEDVHDKDDSSVGKEIPFLTTYVAGTSFVLDEKPLRELKEDDELILRRENNPYDSKAILVLDSAERKLGYIPRKDNDYLSYMMDDGVALMAIVNDIDDNDNGHYRISISVYRAE